jgi:Tfp pilus assembly protein PilO
MAVKARNLHILLGVLLVVLLLRVVVAPFLSWRSDVIQNIEHMSSKLQKLESIYISRDKITGSLSELEAAMAGVQQRFLPISDTGEPAQLNIQKYLENAASSKGIALSSLEWMYQSAGPLYTQVPLKLSFQCYLDQLYELIYSIETYEIFLSVDSLSIAASQRDSKLTCIMEISAYSLNPAPPAKAK